MLEIFANKCCNETLFFFFFIYLCPPTTGPSQVEPNTKLFPAVVTLPTNQNVIQFELGKLKVRPIPEAARWEKKKKQCSRNNDGIPLGSGWFGNITHRLINKQFAFAFPTPCGTEYYADISCHVPERTEKYGTPVPTSPWHPNAGPHDLEPYAQ